ncbi:probable BOI-related E3 ubiquitin-protein ligase 2 [Musa acuminata AAA Group]|uniref:probable BOI-related E3 ubiquitin-protein ligase 2 n=1 Tax=Musa acuminata AAA Group TaxID=214697 RepID=UPI0031E142BE
MAVQAQYPTNAFSPDFRNRALDDVQMMQDPRDLLQLHGGGIGGLGKQEHQILNAGVGFSGRQSEFTCNASGSRKRAREDSMALPSLHNPALSPLIPIPGVLLQSRSLESGATSTSGRHVPSSQAVSPVRDLVSLLLQQNLEIDALVRVQSERLRTGLEEARKRHCRALLSMLEQQAAKRLMEKEAELETASRRNAELEEHVRQLSEENQMWFTMAKNNEAIACGLRTSLEQALLQGASAAAGHERCGDGDGGGAAFPADDAQSCCFEVQERRKACKACGERDVCVLLLPCRHVCVCKDCESKTDTCPVCGSTKNAYLQVFMC